MLFNSLEFIFIFLPLTLGAFGLAVRFLSFPAALRVLLACCFGFYAYWNPWNLPVLIASLAVNYTLGKAVLAAKARDPGRARWMVGCGVALNLIVLAAFKYNAATNAALDALLGPGVLSLALPIGISFYTFQQIAFLVDCLSETPVNLTPTSYALFLSFFPHLLAGPMTHHDELMGQFDRPRINLADFGAGLTLFVFGLFKKVALADNLALIADPVFDGAVAAGHVDLAAGWSASLAYALQIYFDFSGYSDMALGLALLFGVRLPINFASPYKARSIVDFWRRWHISLSRFLREYLYIPLGGGRGGTLMRYRNILLTMALGGLWHGAGWTFLAWGTAHGVLLVGNHLWNETLGRRFVLHRPVALAVTFLCVVIAWVPFRAADGASMMLMLRAMAGLSGTGHLDPTQGAALLVLVGIVMLAPNSQEWLRHAQVGLASRGYPASLVPIEAGRRYRLAWQPTLRWALIAGTIAAACTLELTRATKFLYFQF